MSNETLYLTVIVILTLFSSSISALFFMLRIEYVEVQKQVDTLTENTLLMVNVCKKVKDFLDTFEKYGDSTSWVDGPETGRRIEYWELHDIKKALEKVEDYGECNNRSNHGTELVCQP